MSTRDGEADFIPTDPQPLASWALESVVEQSLDADPTHAVTQVIPVIVNDLDGTGSEPAEPGRPGQPGQSGTRAAVLWAYALTIGRFGITGVVFVWLATLITPEDFGVMALAMAWVTFAQMLAFYGPAAAVIQRAKTTAEHLTGAFWLSVGISLVLAGILVALAPFWARLNDDPRITPLCWALAPTIVLNALLVIPDATLRRAMLFKRLSLRVLLAGVVSGAVGIGLASAGFGVWALVIQQITLTTFSAVAVWLITPWRPTLRVSLSALRDLRRFSTQSVAEFTAYYVATRTDVIMLGMVFNPLAIGLYRFGVRITDMVTEVAAGGLGQVSLPHLARYHQDRTAFAHAFAKIIHVASLLAWPAFAVLAVTAHGLLSLVGPSWVPAAPALQVMCFDCAVGAIGAVMGPATQAAGRPGINATLGWVQAITSVGAIFAVGRLFAHHDPKVQVLAIAATFFVLRLIFMIIMGWINLKWVFKVPLSTLLGPSRHAALAGGVALVVGYGTGLLLPTLPALAMVIIVGGLAGSAAALVLWLRDPLVREIGLSLLARLQRRPAVAASHRA